MFCSETPTERCTGPASSPWAETFKLLNTFNLTFTSFTVHACFVLIISRSLIHTGLLIHSKLSTALDILSTANMEAESWDLCFLFFFIVAMTHLLDNLTQMIVNLQTLDTHI